MSTEAAKSDQAFLLELKQAEERRQARKREVENRPATFSPKGEPTATRDSAKPVGTHVAGAMREAASDQFFSEEFLDDCKARWKAHVDQWRTWVGDPAPRPGMIIDEEASLNESARRKENVVVWRIENLVEHRRLLAAGVTEDLVHCTLENFQTDRPDEVEALRVCTSTRESKRGTVFVLGPTGVGKSHLGVAVARACRNFVFISHRDLWEAHKASWRGQLDPEARLRSIHGLVIDELEIPTSDAELRFVQAVIKTRIERRKLTMISTNLQWKPKWNPVDVETLGEIESLQDVLGVRIMDRMSSAENHVLGLDGQSRRR